MVEPLLLKTEKMMSDKIRQLIKKSDFLCQGLQGTMVVTQDELEKFAELIVKECMEQIMIQSRGECGDYHGEWDSSDILKHFGFNDGN